MWRMARLALSEHQTGANAALNRLCQTYEEPLITRGFKIVDGNVKRTVSPVRNAGGLLLPHLSMSVGIFLLPGTNPSVIGIDLLSSQVEISRSMLLLPFHSRNENHHLLPIDPALDHLFLRHVSICRRAGSYHGYMALF